MRRRESYDCLECTRFTVLAHLVPLEPSSIHRDVDAGREHLHERQRAAEIEEAVGAAERVRNHRTGQDDRLAGGRRPRRGQRSGRLDHRVGAVRDQNSRLRRLPALIDDDRAIGVGHFETVDHHQGPHGHVQPAPAEPQHLGQMRVLERQRAGELVVLLVERAAGHEDPDGHRCRTIIVRRASDVCIVWRAPHANAETGGRMRLRPGRIGPSVVILAVLAVAGVSYAQSDPAVGTWKLNVAKSKYTPGPLPKSNTVTIAAVPNGVHVTAKGEDAAGKPTGIDYTATADGKDMPVKGAPAYDTTAMKRVDANTTEQTRKKEGKTVQTVTRKIS